jgi:PPOX class probable F420-dependent enzyme
MFNLDLSTDFGQRVARRLREERIIWLITVDSHGVPQPNPIWFWWDGETILMYSLPDTAKLRNIAAHPQVTLHFDGDGRGGDIIVITGEARVDPTAPSAAQHTEYAAKYQWGFERIHKTAEEFARTYSVPVHIIPRKVRGH